MDQVVGGAAVALFVIFLGALRATLRAKEGEAGALSAIAVIGGSVVAAGMLVDVALAETSLDQLLALPAATLLVPASAGALATRLAAPRSLRLAERLAVVSLAAWAVLTSLAMVRQRVG